MDLDCGESNARLLSLAVVSPQTREARLDLKRLRARKKKRRGTKAEYKNLLAVNGNRSFFKHQNRHPIGGCAGNGRPSRSLLRVWRVDRWTKPFTGQSLVDVLHASCDRLLSLFCGEHAGCSLVSHTGSRKCVASTMTSHDSKLFRLLLPGLTALDARRKVVYVANVQGSGGLS